MARINLLEDKKRLLSNFLSLSTLEGISMLLPLITLPYLVRVLGVENFGLINFSLSIIMYFNIIVSFGFELSATREISRNRDDSNKVSKIFSSIMIIKTILLLFTLFALTALVLFVDKLNEHILLYYITFGVVIGNVLFPSWLFQGMERMKYITYIHVTSKVIFTILIFFLVKKEADFIYVPLLNSLGAIIGGIYSLWIAHKLFKINFVLPDIIFIMLQLKDSYYFFLSRVANSGSRYYAITIIGLYFGDIIVGYYSMVEKLFYAFMSLGGIVSQTIYPYMSRTKNIKFFKRIFLIILTVSIIILIPIMYFHSLILFLVFNIENRMLSQLFIIIFSGSIFGIASTLVGYPLLAAFGYIKHANNSLIYGSLLYVILISVSAMMFHNVYLVCLSIVVFEITVFLLRYYYIRKEKILKNYKYS